MLSVRLVDSPVQRDYIDALIGIYELNDVSLLRDVYIDAYLRRPKTTKRYVPSSKLPTRLHWLTAISFARHAQLRGIVFRLISPRPER